MLYRLIAPNWTIDEGLVTKRVLEGEFTNEEIHAFNRNGYNIYYLPNYPSSYVKGNAVSGSDIDTFNFVFVDFDLKLNTYKDKDAFIEEVGNIGITPTEIIDSGNGVHVYWQVSGLDAMSYLRFQRRLIRLYNTDEAVGQIFQLMRVPGTVNTKIKYSPKQCSTIWESESIYTAEDLDKLLPPITMADEEYCNQHYNKTYNINQDKTNISDEMPSKFGQLLKDNMEVKDLWAGPTEDRSKNDYRLGHIMFASGFTREEAASVLVNSAKALQRAPVHRNSYAINIIDKIWTFEISEDKSELSSSVEDILARGDNEFLRGKRFACQSFFDGTDHGFRLTQVIGLCAGVGVGKTAIGLNLFKGFVERNPDYIHMFVSLEQPAREIAVRWRNMCGTNTNLHSKVHVLSNYNNDGSYRNLSLTEIQEYILKFQKDNGVKVGCVCLDHIGILRQEDKSGEYQGLRDICAQLKSFAVVTETLLVIQSQTNRDKAGIGDLELYKDAAFGSQSFESFVDFLLVAWQPLKRCYDNKQCPRVTAYKFAKVRHKSKEDKIVEDQCYRLLFDETTENLAPMTQSQEKVFDFFANQAISLRKRDRKTDTIVYKSTPWSQDGA